MRDAHPVKSPVPCYITPVRAVLLRAALASPSRTCGRGHSAGWAARNQISTSCQILLDPTPSLSQDSTRSAPFAHTNPTAIADRQQQIGNPPAAYRPDETSGW